MAHLRRIAVFVDEPDHGQFFWVIHESTEDASVWTDVASSEQPYTMWIDALDAGNVALLKLVEDERIGPQAETEDEDASPVG